MSPAVRSRCPSSPVHRYFAMIKATPQAERIHGRRQDSGGHTFDDPLRPIRCFSSRSRGRDGKLLASYSMLAAHNYEVVARLMGIRAIVGTASRTILESMMPQTCFRFLS